MPNPYHAKPSATAPKIENICPHRDDIRPCIEPPLRRLGASTERLCADAVLRGHRALGRLRFFSKNESSREKRSFERTNSSVTRRSQEPSTWADRLVDNPKPAEPFIRPWNTGGWMPLVSGRRQQPEVWMVERVVELGFDLGIALSAHAPRGSLWSWSACNASAFRFSAMASPDFFPSLNRKETGGPFSAPARVRRTRDTV